MPKSGAMRLSLVVPTAQLVTDSGMLTEVGQVLVLIGIVRFYLASLDVRVKANPLEP
jgi:hypothetical protein